MPVMLGSLRLASQHTNSIRSQMDHGKDTHQPDYVKGKHAGACGRFTTIASALLKAAHSTQLTAALTTLELKDARLESPLPLAISEACPNLITLRLTGAWLDWDKATATSFNGPFAKLQTFVLNQGHGDGDGTQWIGLLQQQVGQLTSLQSLTLTGPPACWESIYAVSCGVAAEQLTHLTVDGPNTDWKQMRLLQETARMVRLQHLVIEDGSSNDAELHVLLSIPSLSRLDVMCFNLANSFADHPLQWRELAFYDITVEQLAKLPLGNTDLQLVCKDYNVLSDDVSIMPGPDISLAILNQAPSNVSRCKGVRWESSVCGGDEWDSVESHLKESLLEKALLLLAGGRTLCLYDIDLNHANTQAVCSNVNNSAGCKSLELADTCACC